MKLSLTVEADAFNVLALNAGRIAVDIDGIELTDLINVAYDNGCTLRIADEPGKVIADTALPSDTKMRPFPAWTGGLHTYRYDDGLKHLVVNFPDDNGWITLFGLIHHNTRCRDKSHKGRFNCPDYDEILQEALAVQTGNREFVPLSQQKTIRCCMYCRISMKILANRNGFIFLAPAT